MECAENLISQEECALILQKSGSGNKIYESHSAQLSSTVDGLVGKHYKLKIRYKENGTQKETSFFLKELNPPNKAAQYLIESINAFEKEKFYYEILIKEFTNNNISTDFAPKCYLCRPSVFVLEDLSLKEYSNTPWKDLLDPKHCKVALKALAKFHASTLLYEKNKSETDENYVPLIKRYPHLLDDILFGDKVNAATKWLECTLKGLLALIDLLPSSDVSADNYKNKLVEVLEGSKRSDQYSSYLQTVLHGDLWSNNFMFKYLNNVPTNSILLDFQILKYGPIALDVVEMIVTNVRRSVRNIHFEELISYYYHSFADICETYGVQATHFMSYKEFLNSCDEFKIAAKLHCAGDHSITFLFGKEMEEAIQTEEGMHTFLFEDRSKSMVKLFNENALYREIMTEDLIELRDLLFQA